jgi:hypothetical protein
MTGAGYNTRGLTAQKRVELLELAALALPADPAALAFAPAPVRWNRMKWAPG